LIVKFTEVAVQEKPQKVLVYGPPKTGKTEIVARLVEAGYNLLWFDMENGWQTIKTRIDPKYWPQIELFVLPDTKENPCAYPTFARCFTMKPVKFCQAHGRIGCIDCTKSAPTAFDTVDLSKLDTNTVVVGDSLTQLSSSAMNNAAKGIDPLSLEFKHYAAQGNHLDALLNAIQQAPFHVAIISHEGAIEGIDGYRPCWRHEELLAQGSEVFRSCGVYHESKQGVQGGKFCQLQRPYHGWVA